MKKNILTACAIIAAASMTLVSCNSKKKSESKEAKSEVKAEAKSEVATEEYANEAASEKSSEFTSKPAAKKCNIAYFDLAKVIESYDFASDIQSELNAKLSAAEKDLTSRGKKIEKADQDLANKIQKGLITTAAANEQGKKLQEQVASFQQYQQKKSQEMAEEQQVAMNRILDAIHTFTQNYNAEAGYDMIICNQAGTPVFVANPELDITDAIIEGLNKEYIKTKSQK